MSEKLSVTASSDDWWEKSLFCDYDAMENALRKAG